ncbi:putative transmembrane protein [Gregarina niphandrodes]|uniref:Transmembrane protein n=1 Tax=Gregarina niphandrodes TaxID=110365 RepID=A0A023AZH8_GRENI|nr:putative transmembrane protein [Gregarina niphandrodes]EZG43889.1 putative transmembrane protein [Gregarina niphandrodes]|eukprot:XP_011132932.1 putative transmembrane protein [Gregarina niphandrodes]
MTEHYRMLEILLDPSRYGSIAGRLFFLSLILFAMAFTYCVTDLSHRREDNWDTATIDGASTVDLPASSIDYIKSTSPMYCCSEDVDDDFPLECAMRDPAPETHSVTHPNAQQINENSTGTDGRQGARAGNQLFVGKVPSGLSAPGLQDDLVRHPGIPIPGLGSARGRAGGNMYSNIYAPVGVAFQGLLDKPAIRKASRPKLTRRVSVLDYKEQKVRVNATFKHGRRKSSVFGTVTSPDVDLINCRTLSLNI